jgi:hypothetical protein
MAELRELGEFGHMIHMAAPMARSGRKGRSAFFRVPYTESALSRKPLFYRTKHYRTIIPT